ncbi:MAG: hypothetical protein ACKVOA_07840 [Methylophilaceae bacterium]
MFAFKNKSFWQGSSLISLILLTRMSHFGYHVYLPDATLAALLLGGLLIQSKRWLGLAIACAFAMDFYALGFKGVSDYCMSLGYWGLIPTYIMVWASGRWLAKRATNTATKASVAFGVFSAAFVLSNAFWYAFSDKVATMSILQFSQAVSKYYVPYMGYSLMYLGFAWLVAQIWINAKPLNAQIA